ncbi:reprolysin-like metallopeptidase [Chryseobacterium sp. CT-SW4]|uniref:reprolysin-like metallopeptidase n=1 Tax=Chryseobacterium sp. SW-1 TaxID=3157343 RepID=UPI003B010298
MKKRLLLLISISTFFTLNAQRWEPVSQKTSQLRKEVEVQYAYRVDLSSLRNLLQDAVETGPGAKPIVVSLPTVEGKIEKFAVYSNPVMEKSMAERYQLGSYVGVGIDDPSKYIRFSTSPTELQSLIIKDGKFQFIEPISTDKQVYGVFYKTKRNFGNGGFECSTGEKNIKDIIKLKENGKKKLSNVGITSRPSNTKYRTYRLALSTTGEYTQHFDPSGGITNTVSQMNATITRVNGVFEKDFGVHLVIQDFPNIIYTDPATDPYTGNLNLQLQQTLNTQVGNGNYDIGHVFNAAGGNGNAGGIGVVCTDPANGDNESLGKGAGFTQSSNPVGDTFDIDYVAHEMGHQLGANHTFSNTTSTDASESVNVEPGGGTTIMGYAGITYDNVQMNSDAYFHYISIDQILNNLETKTCGTSEEVSINTAPVISPLSSYTIPKGTAYYLEASATDADPLNYTWEQYDSTDDYSTISGDSGWGYNPKGALTRSYFGTSSGRRYFPSLPIVLNGNLTDKTAWETVSYIPRTLHYAVTVRDENTVRPLLSSSETTVTVGNEGPFKFNGLTSSTVLYNNATNTLEWDVAGTNLAPYNVSNVKVDYTTDNGNTWTDLVASTPNTGSYVTQFPTDLSGAVKLRISAIGNIFYAVSPSIIIGSAPTSLSEAPTGVSTIDTEVFKTTARISWNSVPGGTYSINYRKSGTANWNNTTSNSPSVVLSSLEDETDYEVQVAAVVNNVSGSFSAPYSFKTKGLKTGVDYCILNSGSPYAGAIGRVQVSNVNYLDLAFRSYKDISEDASKIINLVKGNSYPIKIYGLYRLPLNMTYNVWIDYNRNGIFETDEKVYTSGAISPSSSIVSLTGNFTVPSTAYSGDKTLRMRVASNYSVPLNIACDELPGGVGGVVDLSVKISDNALAVNEIKAVKSGIEIYPNPADTFIGVKNTKGKTSYKIYSADGRLIQSGKVNDQLIDISGLIKGIYLISIQDENTIYNSKLLKR